MEDKHPVTLARGYAGVTQKELADLINRSQSFVARLERFEFDPEPLAGELARAFVARGFRFPESYFVTRGFTQPDSAITFRKRAACPAPVRDRAVFYAVMAASSVAPLVGRFVKYPPCDIPLMPVDWNRAEHDARRIGAEAAKSLRAYWGLGWGPISDVIRLVESKGVRVFYVRERSEHLDAFAFWSRDIPFIFLNQNQPDPARLRFDLAHELGHLVMHRDVEMDLRTKGHSLDIIENMAHGFAAEFLAPWEAFRQEAPVVPDLGRLGHLKARWRMSMQAMVKHMHSNGALSDASYSNAFRRFAALGYRRGPEPGWIVPDVSVIHSKFLAVVEERGLSVATLAENEGVSEQLLGDMVPQATQPDRDLTAFL